MHDASYDLMRRLLKRHAGKQLGGVRVLDVGSRRVVPGDKTYRPLIERLGGMYCGLDTEPGDNVDVVIPEREPWPVEPAAIVISGQCLEHTRWPWLLAHQLAAVTKPGGLVVIIAPWFWHLHRHPLDCWRILPDGMRALFEWSGITTIATDIEHRDCWGVGRKP